MGYAVYELNDKRDGGYGVPAYCDHPGCKKEIDRGMAHACGSEPFSEYGCGLYFCTEHLHTRYPRGHDRGVMNCHRCWCYKKPYKPKPEHPTWLRHKLIDKSWQKWREENPEKVAEYKKVLGL